MAYETGGRADKYGNRFEYNWVVYKILDVIEEKIACVILEALGNDESGVDLWVIDNNGNKEAQQCKGRDGSEEHWTFASINEKRLWNIWKQHLDRENNVCVSLVSPLAFTILEDITNRARNNKGDPSEFYNIQIKKAGIKTQNLFENVCKTIAIDPKNDVGCREIFYYFKRIYYRQCPDTEMKTFCLNRINSLFIGNPEVIYSLIIDYILTQDIYGKKITAHSMKTFFESQKVIFRNLANDHRILPRIQELNEEYKQSFNPFSNGIIYREESRRCCEYIKHGKSVIIHGQAGTGKSGCTTNIINFCEQESIPYLAIKLDKRIPLNNTEAWSQTMALPASISHCVDSIAKHNNAVIILDQLDALRWTQAHSGSALTVCLQLINELKVINSERETKISLILVCRSYDLENDSGIKNLFKENTGYQWEKINVDFLNDTEIKQVVGPVFDSLSKKIRNLLKVASNLYIWEKLDGTQNNERIEATYHLVKEWWNQIVAEASLNNLDTNTIERIKNNIVTFCDSRGSIAVPCVLVNIPLDYKMFLISNGFLIESNNTISFSHQSILDCFLSEQMIQKYYDGKILKEIIGDIDKQTPGRRYQVQIFLQQLTEILEEDFLEFGKKLLEQTDIRYSLKYVFFEVISQIDSPKSHTQEFVLSLLEDDEWKKPIINTVIRGHKVYIVRLIENGTLEEWMNKNHQDTVIDLCASIAPDYDDKLVAFIKKYALKDDSHRNWNTCFYRPINEGSEEFFELRLEFYKQHPRMFENYMDLKNMLLLCEIRTIKILALMLDIKNSKYESSTYRYAEEFSLSDTDLFIHNYMAVLNILVPYLPTNDYYSKYGNWSARYSGKSNLERTCILIIKAANREFVKAEPERFLKYYEFGFGKGNDLYNEIILDAFQYISDEHADYILNYLQTDISRNCFEESSGKGNKLFYTKRIVKRFSKICSESVLRKFEAKVIHYISSQAKDRLKRRIKQNREQKINGYERVYWDFWGDFQYEILSSINKKRRSTQTNQLFLVLDRKFVGKTTIYDYSNDSCFGNVVSPVSGKKLSAQTWINIIKNPKIKNLRKSKWMLDKGVCIESSLEEFSMSFRTFVAENSIEIIDLFLDEGNDILECFVDSLFSGIASSNKIEEISCSKIESLIKKFGYNYTSYRATYICEIIEKKPEDKWSNYMLSCIEDIALHHIIPKLDNPVVTSKKDKKVETVEMIEGRALNCSRGNAIRAIAKLLWEDSGYYPRFKNCISKLTTDADPIINYAVLWALWPVYNIEKTWAVEKIMYLFEKNYKMIGFYDSRWMFCHCYADYKAIIVVVINKAAKTEDKRLLKVSGHSISELYMIYDEYNNWLDIYIHAEKYLRQAMLEMIITYFGVNKYKSKAKAILIKVIDIENDIDNNFLWGRLFRNEILDAKEDRDLIKKILYSKLNKRVLMDFSEFIKKQGNLKEYSDLIIESGLVILKKDQINSNQIWGLETEISKLIISLYDITSVSNLEKDKAIAFKCLNIWDKMYEYNVGMARLFTDQMMNV
ncbi:hypothetical protein H5999_08190 [[Clostridium] spiroforme]|nr:hypothetical protein [Thomasclavelia spiroformis]